MKLYVFVDSRHPQMDLVRTISKDPDLQLEKIEIEVEEGEDIIAATKAALGI